MHVNLGICYLRIIDFLFFLAILFSLPPFSAPFLSQISLDILTCVAVKVSWQQPLLVTDQNPGSTLDVWNLDLSFLESKSTVLLLATLLLCPSLWFCIYVWRLFRILGMSNTMNLSFGSLEKKGTNTSDMQLGRYMQSLKIWPLTFPSTSTYMIFWSLGHYYILFARFFCAGISLHARWKFSIFYWKKITYFAWCWNPVLIVINPTPF